MEWQLLYPLRVALGVCQGRRPRRFDRIVRNGRFWRLLREREGRPAGTEVATLASRAPRRVSFIAKSPRRATGHGGVLGYLCNLSIFWSAPGRPSEL